MLIPAKYYRNCLPIGQLLAGCLLLALAGCGIGDISGTSGTSGGGLLVSGVGTGGTGVVKSSAAQLSPALSTGFAGAIVFLDANNNGLLDSDEPFAYTDAQGRYSLPAAAVAQPGVSLLLQTVAGATVELATGQVVRDDSVTVLAGGTVEQTGVTTGK